MESFQEIVETDDELKRLSKSTCDKVDAEMEELQFSKALENIWEFIGYANKFIEDKKPWLLAKTSATRTQLAAVIGSLAGLLKIFPCLSIRLCREPLLKFNDNWVS